MTYSTGTGLDSKALHSEMRHNLSAQASSLALSSRPATAALGPHLRGSRPNSAAIAATIEGFENDYMVRQQVLHLGLVGCGLLTPKSCLHQHTSCQHRRQAGMPHHVAQQCAEGRGTTCPGHPFVAAAAAAAMHCACAPGRAYGTATTY